MSTENQSPAQVQSTEPQDSSDSAESQNPWEVEFREEDYEKFNFTAPNGDKIVTWREDSLFGKERRCLYEWAENGNIKISVYHNLATEEYFEQEYYENGSLKRNKNQTADSLFKEELDTDGFRTYCLSQHSNWEVECIADDTGKLVKVIENGTEILDSVTLTQYAEGYNFRA